MLLDLFQAKSEVPKTGGRSAIAGGAWKRNEAFQKNGFKKWIWYSNIVKKKKANIFDLSECKICVFPV